MELNYYSILGISINASSDDIKRAYRRLAKQFHPDLNPGKEASLMLNHIQQAYDTLSNEHLRIVYDMKLKQAATTKQTEKNFHYDFKSNFPSDTLYPQKRVNYKLIIAIVGTLIIGIAVACYLFLTGDPNSEPTTYPYNQF